MKVRRSNLEKRTADGIVFDSIEEMNRYHELKLMQRVGEIRELRWQTKFDIQVNGQHICYYTPDFSYIDKDQVPHTEDVKGFRRSEKTGKLLPRVDREFGIKCKLLRAVFGITVEVV